jgi:hypothetical protein
MIWPPQQYSDETDVHTTTPPRIAIETDRRAHKKSKTIR